MVFQKRSDHGLNGYWLPATPKATRSARKRVTIQKRAEENHGCAFDLLASVAGNALLEKESSDASSNASSGKDLCVCIQKECRNANELLKSETSDGGRCDKKYMSDPIPQGYDQNCWTKESPNSINADHSGSTSSLTTSDCSERFVSGKVVNDKGNEKFGNFPSKHDGGSAEYVESSGCKLDDESDKVKVELLHKPEKKIISSGREANAYMDEDSAGGKSPAFISPNGNTKSSLYARNFPHIPSSQGFDNVKVVSRDDDENSSGCPHLRPTTMPFSSVTRIGDRRIRKILASRYWKVDPKIKDERLSNSEGDLKCIYHNRKNCYKRQRSQMTIPFKKRKLFYWSSDSNSDRGDRNDSISCPPKKGITSDSCGFSMKTNGAPGKSRLTVQHTALQSRDSHVKLRIKSFRVPELFIEIPESETIGSLKRTVMEAVTAVLGGGLHVGVILQGKKVRDDNKTLFQTGISRDNQLDALGFTLEPNSPQNVPLAVAAADSPLGLSSESPQPLTRSSSNPTIVHEIIQGRSGVLTENQVTHIGNLVESDHDSVPSPASVSVQKGATESKALVAVPNTGMGAEALTVVPGQKKSNQHDIVQRRIRRPFSVAEVEALVQAVEKLGTGRWRDVKLCAFDNAKHRTYVDLKDKWKTLVHTARISPQQRRGEPVPQELLDRVITAHAYWSQQQTKQHLKQQQHPETCLLL